VECRALAGDERFAAKGVADVAVGAVIGPDGSVLLRPRVGLKRQSSRDASVGDDPAVGVSLGAAASQRTVRSMSSPALAGPVARRRKGGTSLLPFRAARGPFAGLWLVG
jgi:hypothetical protein